MRGAFWKTLVNVAVFLAVATGLAIYAFVNWIGAGLIQDSYRVTVPMPEAGGLVRAQEVTVRGNQVGVIEDIEMTTDGVDLELSIEVGEHVPARAVVQILRRSPIGEQALNLIPVTDSWQPPAGERVIPTRVPIPDRWTPAEPDSRIDPVASVTPASVADLLDRAQELLTQVDGDDLGTVVHELATALGGRTDTLKELNRDSAELGETLIDGIPEFERLLDTSEPVLAVLRDHRDALATSFTHAADVSETLAGQRGTLERILDEAPRALDEAELLIRTERADLSCLGDDLLTLNERFSQDEHLEEIARLLDLNRFFYGGFDAGTQWDPYRPGVLWARVNILLFQEAGGQPYVPRRPTPPTLPGAACESPFGIGVNAVRQTDPPPIPPDPTSPGIDYAPRVEGAGDEQPPPSSGEERRGAPRDGDAGATPATGGGAGLLAAVVLLAGAAAIRRR
ncbi:MAG: MCE family protein [Actinobacteria bacterium]|nr:MCE family protein [Actinomycetota bacterium]